MRFPALMFTILLGGYAAVYLLASKVESIDLFANIAQFAALSVACFQFLRIRSEIQDPESRRTSLIFFFGLCLWTLGQLLVLYSEILLRRVSTGTVSSAYFLIGYCLLAASLYRFAKSLSKSTGTNISRKACFYSCTLLLIIAAVLGKPILSPHRVSTSLILNLFYTGFDLIMIGLSSFLIQIARRIQNSDAVQAFSFLLSGFALIGMCNFIGMDAEFDTPLYHLLGLLYMSSYFLIAFSAGAFGKSQAIEQSTEPLASRPNDGNST